MPQYEHIRVSDEFIDLCEAQLSLLFHNFLVEESAVYLTENYQQEPKLVPIIVYPHSSVSASNNLLPSFSADLVNESVGDTFYDLSQAPNLTAENFESKKTPSQLVLPLIYQDIVLGLLAMTRKHQSWQAHEILEVKEIAQTIAIARMMEEKQQLLESKYHHLQTLQESQTEHLDDFLHQLKNPLTAIRTFAKLLLKNILPDNPSYNTSQSIVRESDRLQDLITDFNQQWQQNNQYQLSLKNPEFTSFFLTEKIESLTPINVIEVVIPILETIEMIAAEKNIRVYRNLNYSVPLVLSNQKALTEIVNNLLENAVKYTPENGSILLEIDLNFHNCLEIKIADTGYGIPPEDQEHIFERHYRGVQEMGKIQGTGLGLAIVKELCHKINLEISLTSPYLWTKNQAYKGTQFCLTFSQN
jgi:signal transduction histidine kinase